MTRQSVPIDISAMPEVARLVEQAMESNTPLRLQQGDEDVALLTSRRTRHRRRRLKRPTEEQRRILLSAVGSWKGLGDVDQFKHDIKSARGSKRAPVQL